MSYIVVENFSAGLDTRRHPLTARPGTLQTLKNAHVSRGGEIEKRKKFVKKFEFSSGMTFGMLASSETIYVFGSYPGSFTVPAGLTFQRLYHPDGHLTLNHYVNEIVYSTLYGGKPFVIAKFGTGDVYPYYDGVIIKDFVNGITRSAMGNVPGFGQHLASCIDSGYTGVYTIWSPDDTLTITGPSGVDYDLSIKIDAPMTASVSVSTAYVAPVLESLATASFAITGGTFKPASKYRLMREAHIDNAKVTGIYSGGSVAGGGEEITGISGSGGFDMYSPPIGPGGDFGDPGERVAWALTYFINQNTVNTGFSAKYVFEGYRSGHDIASITMYAPYKFDDNDPTILYNDKEVWIEFNDNPTLNSAISEVIDVSTITASPYNTGRFIAKYGVLSNGVINGIKSITVDGVETLGKTIFWNNSNTDTMNAISTQINTYTSTSEYYASVSESKVIMTGATGTGATLNGHQLIITTVGDVVASGITKFDGGVTSVPANSKKYAIVLGGTFAAGKTATITVTPKLDPNNPIYFGATRVGISNPVSALTFKSKEHITSGSTLFFSGVNDPTKWGFTGVGAGFINLSNNSGGNEVLTGLALYQGKLAAFARRTVQIWAIDPDPANNVQGQVLSNTGAIGAKSIISVGEIDVFYLSDSGVRSLRARDASNAAIVNDVGTPVDNLVLKDLESLTDTQKTKCPCTIEPIDGRYWLAIGSKIYVYSYFPGSQVAAWSTYEPGFEPEHFTTKDGRVYVRPKRGTDGSDPNEETIYLYGGDSGNEYDDCEVEVVLPYLDGGKPAHMKTLNGIDMTCEGYWQVYIGMDPLATSARDLIATVNQPTFSLGRIMAAGQGTHVGVRLVNNTSGYARLANLIAHFDLNEAN